MRIKNLIAATYTPMKADLSLNYDLVKPYGEFLKSNKLTGAFVNGSTGDFVSLSTIERKLIIESWAKNKPKDFILVNHVGHTNMQIAKELALHSADKVDAISSISPYFFTPPNVQSLVDYCATIAQCAPKLPFYYYHIPVLSKANFNMLEFLNLASKQIPNLVGIKFSENDLSSFKGCCKLNDGKYNLLFGVDENFASSLTYGAEGWVGSTYNHLAPIYYKIKTAFENGNLELSTNLQAKAVQFVTTLNNLGGYNGMAKSFMRSLGVDCGPSRYPHKTGTQEELNSVMATFDNLEISEHFSN